jgi:choline dehydrogenase-like flavoprotein
MTSTPTPLAPGAPLPVTDAAALRARGDRRLSLRADVVVVGSGAGGAVMAYELARAGRSVLVLEAGRYVPSTQFTEKTVDMFDKVFQDRGAQLNTDGDIMVLQGRCVGGSTVVNGAVCFRIPDHVLEVWHRTHGLTHLAHDRLHGLYAKIERRLSVHENGPHELSANARVLMTGAERLGWSHKPLSRNTKDCALTGFCFHGCASDRKQSMLVTYLPWAAAHGARLFADTRAERFRLQGGRVVGLDATVRDPATGEIVCRVDVTADRYVSAAGPIQTPILLMNSEVPNPSRALGAHLALHPSALVMAEMPEPIYGWRGATVGSYVDAFEHPDKGGFLLEGGMAAPDVLSVMLPGQGHTHVEAMTRYAHFAATAALIHDENVGRVSWDGRDKSIHYRVADVDRPKLHAAMKAAARVFFAAGARRVYLPAFGDGLIETQADIDRVVDGLPAGPSSVRLISYHPQGTCRMATSATDGVVGPRGEVFGARDLFVADASLFPTSILVNPQMTVYALSNYIAEEMLST